MPRTHKTDIGRGGQRERDSGAQAVWESVGGGGSEQNSQVKKTGGPETKT